MGEENTAPEWLSGIEDESVKESLGGFESQEKLFETIGYKIPEAEVKDWREGLPDDMKKTAERFTSPEDALRSIEDFRKRDSQVRVPGKEATDEEKASYYKAIGVPENAEGYEFKLAEGEESTPEIEAANKQWAERLHGLTVPTETANELVKFLQEDLVAAQAAQNKADEENVKVQEDALRAEWKGDDYEKNKTVANRAFTELANRAGIDIEELTSMETKDGKLLMDDARMMRVFAAVGREMAEGSLGATLTESEINTAEDQLIELRKQITSAQADGNSKKANKLFEQEQALIAKMKGNKNIVGDGRAT